MILDNINIKSIINSIASCWRWAFQLDAFQPFFYKLVCILCVKFGSHRNHHVTSSAFTLLIQNGLLLQVSSDFDSVNWTLYVLCIGAICQNWKAIWFIYSVNVPQCPSLQRSQYRKSWNFAKTLILLSPTVVQKSIISIYIFMYLKFVVPFCKIMFKVTRICCAIL